MEDIQQQLKELRKKIAHWENIKKTMEEASKEASKEATTGASKEASKEATTGASKEASKEATTGASKEATTGASVVPEVMEMVRSRPVFKGERCDGNCAGCRRDLRNCFGCDCNGAFGGRKRRRTRRITATRRKRTRRKRRKRRKRTRRKRRKRRKRTRRKRRRRTRRK